VWLTAATVAMTIARVAIWKAGSSLLIWQFSPEIRPVGLIIGCILAMIPLQRLRPNALIAPVLLAALLAIGFYTDSSAYTSLGAPLTASLVTVGLIGCLQHQSAVGGLLASSPMRYTGKISYGLYLHHWPIFILGESLKIHLPFHLYAAALIALIMSSLRSRMSLSRSPACGLRGGLLASGWLCRWRRRLRRSEGARLSKARWPYPVALSVL
jgi:peptidoglycan/LPS O-acetylase OafA/YrhL